MRTIKLFIKVIFTILILCPLPVAGQDYILGDGDVITISVYKQPDLKTTVRISGDGMITLPLIGELSVSDLSVHDLSEKIEALLADGYIVDPQANIFIEEFRSRKANILGEINTPGLYELEGHTTLFEFISRAGGLTENAACEIIIHRNQAGSDKKKVITVNLRELMEQQQSVNNINIKDGDNIYVPTKQVFYVSGEVKDPGAYNFEEGLTVIQAIIKAGGESDKAAPKRIEIIRSKDGKERILKNARMDQLVHPNDVILVPESYF
jgi:polysaccharide export outer membrane protein